MLLLLFLVADLTGLWYGPPPPSTGNKRDLYVSLRVSGDRVSGEVESSTRNAPISEGVLLPDGFRGVAAHIWDGKPVRRPIEGRLQGDVLHVRVQGWPGGPMQDFDLKRVSRDPAIPRLPKLPIPALKDLPPNGLAQTPPMGWNSWNKFGCRVSDKMIREMADALVSTGLRDAGYTYLNIDDCWQDSQRFPDMKALADYVHSKGLKVGIYSSPGPKTCAGYDGSYGKEEQDAKQFAAWGIDLLKYDWCSAGKYYSDSEMRAVYQKMGSALQASGRPIVYSVCQYGLADVQKWGPLVGGNLWRTTSDIGDNWNSIAEIGFGSQNGLAPYAGPGHWNDPDMLEVGNGGMSTEEYRTHFTLWAMLAAPLLAGNDIRSMSIETRDILLNREVIAIDQDPLGKQGSAKSVAGDIETWERPLADGIAIAIFNKSGKPATVRPGLAGPARDVWAHKDLDQVPETVTIPGHGVVAYRIKQPARQRR